MGTAMFFTLVNPIEGVIDNVENVEFLYQDELQVPEDKNIKPPQYYARIDLDSSITCYPNARFIASKLDTDINENTCRLAFHGTMLTQIVKENTPA
jgi:hypothetical protein